MKKPYWNMFICILINFGFHDEIAAEDDKMFDAKLNKTSENLTTSGYEIVYFNDTNAEVRNNRNIATSLVFY